jgi:DNA-binding HxlR family transcriptional regulator
MSEGLAFGVVNDNGDEGGSSVERSLTILGERWTLLIVGEALMGATRFIQFESKLGLPPNSLADRLSMLVDYGVMIRGSYQEPGQRTRPSYHLTAAGRQLHVLLAALSDWGDKHLPMTEGPTLQRRSRRSGLPVRVAFIDERGYEVPADDVSMIAMGH